MKSTILSAFLFGMSLISSGDSHARLIQILHTNDTHSHLNHAIHDKQTGGVERLKTLIDQYKTLMNDAGIKTIVLDAGDFSEGNLYYMAEKGRSTFNVHNQMGYDVGILGNHDYLMGTNELNRLLGEFDLRFHLLAANIEPSAEHTHLQQKIKPYAELEVDGLKIGILGLTTNEIFYKWRFEKGLVTNPLESAQKYEKILKERGNDAIIALTHLGLFQDMRMVARSRHIDLVVGGHSHDALFKEKYGKNRNGRQIPVVQAGAHTDYLGRLIIDVEKNQPLKVVKYELIPVNNSADDPDIKQLVEGADQSLDFLYGKEWLETVVGKSSLKPKDPDGMKKWAAYVAHAIKEKTDAQIAIHAPPMNGVNYPVGQINRRDLYNSFPRAFDINEKFGWNIYTTKIMGVWLRLTIQSLSLFGQPLILSGVELDYVNTPIGLKIRKMRINGEKIKPFKVYTVAFTEGVVKGAQGVDDRTIAILRHPKDTGIKIWHTLEERLRKTQVDDQSTRTNWAFVDKSTDFQ